MSCYDCCVCKRYALCCSSCFYCCKRSTAANVLPAAMVYLHVHLSAHLSACLFVRLPVCLRLCLLLCLRPWACPCPYPCPCPCPSPCPCPCLSVCLSVCLSRLACRSLRLRLRICVSEFLRLCVTLCLCVPVSVSVCLSGFLWPCVPMSLSGPLSVLSLSVPLSVSHRPPLPRICLPACLSVFLSVRLSVCLSVCLPVRLSVCLSVCLSACLSVGLSACPSVCPSVCLSVCPPVRLSVLLCPFFPFVPVLCQPLRLRKSGKPVTTSGARWASQRLLPGTLGESRQRLFLLAYFCLLGLSASQGVRKTKCEKRSLKADGWNTPVRHHATRQGKARTACEDRPVHELAKQPCWFVAGEQLSELSPRCAVCYAPNPTRHTGDAAANAIHARHYERRPTHLCLALIRRSVMESERICA